MEAHRALARLSECRGDEIWSIEHCRERGVPEDWIDDLSDAFESGYRTDRETIYVGNTSVNQYHGVRDLARPGTIHISARNDGESLMLEVRDNGQGMSPDEQKALRDNLDQPFDEVWEEALYGGSPSSGTGVRNVHQRIRLYFGEAYGLTLESTEGEGTCMRATLPLLGMEEEL